MHLLIVYAQMPLINAVGNVFNETRGIMFGLRGNLQTHFVNKSSETQASLQYV